jgi:(p)ppGpp synthase/HD superfamily hydrolase
MEHFDEIEKLARELHGEQKRKYTGDPYVNHTVAVAQIVKTYGGDESMVYAAILHDVLEDTPTTEDDLFSYITEITGDVKLSMDVLRLVRELTDVYTKESYPDVNRRGRKELEAMRLGRISPKAQTIKYADLLDNGMDIMSNDPNFGKVYLREKEEILKYMNKGNQELYNKCLEVLENGKSIG